MQSVTKALQRTSAYALMDILVSTVKFLQVIKLVMPMRLSLVFIYLPYLSVYICLSVCLSCLNIFNMFKILLISHCLYFCYLFAYFSSRENDIFKLFVCFLTLFLAPLYDSATCPENLFANTYLSNVQVT